jgi:hypothetical protein
VLRLDLRAHPGHVASIMAPLARLERGKLRRECVEHTRIGAQARLTAGVVGELVEPVRLEDKEGAPTDRVGPVRHGLEGAPASVARRDQACTALGRGRPILEPATLGFMGLPGVCRRVRRCQEKGQGQRGGEHGRRS